MPLDAVRATAATPDEQVKATIAERDRIAFRLAPGYFHRASASDMAWQVTRLMPRLVQARQDAYYRERSHDFGREIRQESPPNGRRDHEYLDSRAQILARGGDEDSVEVVTIGLSSWTVTVDDAWFSSQDEQTWSSEMSMAASETFRSFMHQARRLKVAIYA